jgi:hypothetical protein
VNRILIALLLLTACGDDDRSPMPDAGDTPDASGPSDLGQDGGPPPLDCTEITVGETFQIAPDLESRIHPSVVFGGDALWLTVTALEEGTSVFDIFLVKMGCDGRQEEPVLVSTTEMANDIDADLALGPEGLLVAWQADEGTGTIETWVRLHDAETGEPLGDPRKLEPPHEGEPVSGTVWSPTVLASDTGFDVIGERGIEAASAFQAYVQPLDAMGLSAGATIEPFFEAMVGQNDATGLRTDDGLTLAWTREPTDGDPTVVTLGPGGEPVTVPSSALEAGGPSLAAFGDERWVAYSAGGGGSRRIELFPIGGDTVLPLGGPGHTDVVPRLVAGETALGLAWLRITSGFRADLFTRRVDVSGTAITAGAEVEIATIGDVFAPYAIDLVHVRGDTFFLSWAEGEGSDSLRSAGRFIEL